VWTTQRESTKRRLDLAEDMLALFYEVADAIRFMRSPPALGEGNTRPRPQGEREETAAARDRAYIVIERYNKREQIFKLLAKKRYKYMAVFRGESNRPFEMIEDVVHKIFCASSILGEYYWPNTKGLPPVGNQFATDEQISTFLKGMNEQQAVFSAM